MRLYQDSAPPGENGLLGKEKIRFRANPRRVFPSTDISHIRKRNSEYIQKVTQNSEIIEVILTFMGLYGVDSPLPSYFPETIAELTDDDSRDEGAEDGVRALRHFLDVFDHRFYSLYFRSWKKYRYYLNYKAGAKDRFSQCMLSLLGLGTPDLQRLVDLEVSRFMAYMGILGQQTRCAEALQRLISDYFGNVDVKITQFVPHWVSISKQFRAQVGARKNGVRTILGENVIIGGRVRDLNGKFRIVLGPLDFESFCRFLPGEPNSRELYSLVSFYVNNQLSFDVELLLRKEDVPRLKFGTKMAQLARISWVGKPYEDIVSVVFSLDRRKIR